MFTLDRTFKALADPTRRAILHALRRGPAVAGDLADRVGVSPSALSFHLKILRDADLVDAQRHGQFIRYTLNTSVFDDVIQFCIEHAPRNARRTAARPSRGSAARHSTLETRS